MSKLIYTAISIACIGLSAHAQDGHNGIRFDMTQKQIEAKGFTCNPPKEKRGSIVAICHHMDMTGIAFGIPAQDYEVRIGPSKRVDEIQAELTGVRSIEDISSLHRKVEDFFPVKDLKLSRGEQGSYNWDLWRSKNNAGLSLYMSSSKKTISLQFFSPRSMVEMDKILAKRAAASDSKENGSVSN